MAISEASVASYDARLKLQQSMIRQAAATLASAEADLEREEQARLQQARANLQLAQNDLDNTVIRSPVSRIAGNRAGRSVVRQSQDPTTVAGAAAACLC